MAKTKRPSLQNEAFWGKTDDKLHYIIKDAGEAAQANRDRPEAEGKYLDQMNDAATVLSWRADEAFKILRKMRCG